MSLGSLPVEILLNIIEALIPYTAIIGENATWVSITHIPTWNGAGRISPSRIRAGEKLNNGYNDLIALRL